MARARCAYCTRPVESPLWDGHGMLADELVRGFSVEWCPHCRTRVPALLGRMEPVPAEVVEMARPAVRDGRWSVN